MLEETTLSSLEPLGRYVLCAVMLLRKCGITHIRELIRASKVLDDYSDFLLASKETMYELQDASLISMDGNFYVLYPEFTYSDFKRLCALREMNELVTFCHHSLPDKAISVTAKMTARLVYANCAAVYAVKNNVEGINDLYRTGKDRLKDSWYSAQNKNGLLEVSDICMALMNFSGFTAALSDFSPRLAEAFFPYALLCSVVLPESISIDWRGMLKAHQVKDAFPFAVAALLEGDRDMLEELCHEWKVNSTVRQGFVYFLDGKWEKAAATLKSSCQHVPQMEKAVQPAGVLMILLCLVGEALTSDSYQGMNSLIRRINNTVYYEVVEHCLRSLYVLFQMHNNISESIKESEIVDCSELPLLVSLLGLCESSNATYSLDVIDKAYEAGCRMMSAGRRFLGIQMLHSAGTLMSVKDSRRAQILELTAVDGIVPFRPMIARKSFWENMLDDMESLLLNLEEKKTDSSNASEAPLQGIISWHLEAQQYTWAPRRCSKPCLHEIVPMFHRKLKNGTYGAGKMMLIADFREGMYDAFLTQEEHRACQMAASNKQLLLLPSAIERLVDSENMHIGDDLKTVKLVKEEMPISSMVTENGDVVLELKYTGGYDNEDQYFLDNTEEGICRFCKVKADEPLKHLFKKYGNRKGAIIVPCEGAERVKAMLVKASANYGLTGELAALAYQSLPHREGGVELHALLKRNGDVFVFDFRNKPLPDSDVMYAPGGGSAEKPVTLPDGKRVLLVRELEKENAAMSQLVKSCSDLPRDILKTHVYETDDLAQTLSILGAIKDAGIVMDWQAGKPLRVTAAIGSNGLKLSNTSAMDWFSIGGELTVSDSECMRLNELLKAVEGRTGCFVKLSEDAYVQLTQELIRKLELLNAAGTAQKNGLKISAAALPMLATAFDGELPERLALEVDKVRQAFKTSISVPKAFQGTLRGYQEEGFRYLSRLADCGIGCCLADDMGLGKTIQVLALLLREASKGPALVLCPASLCGNWEREAARFAPSLNTVVLPTAEDRAYAVEYAGKSDVILCSYGIMLTEFQLFAAKTWHTIILDEAQAIKNHAAKRSRSSKKLKGDIRIAVTGTPVENHLLELWSIFDFLNPGLLGTASDFELRFCEDGMARPELKKLVSPLIMRRRKSDVLDDLPPKTEIVIPVELPQNERAMYETLRRNAVEALTGDAPTHLQILAQLSRLRTFCCAPELAYGQEMVGEGAKLQRLMELLQELEEGGCRALVFSQFVSFLAILRRRLDALNVPYQYLDGSMVPSKRQEAVDAFQNGQGDFFLISLKAGGTGLNLTAANYVIIADPWWNPAVEEQASDRAHRIGQKNPVTVYRLIASQTVEERILELHAKKRMASDDILNNAERSGITIDELMSLFN